jgi:hypothetical protein
MIRKLIGRAFVLGASVIVLTSATGPDTIVRPPKFNYTMSTLPNGLQVVSRRSFDADRACGTLVSRRVEGRKPGAPVRALVRASDVRGSRNEAGRAPVVDHEHRRPANAFTDEDATVYWETVPAQFLPLVLWLRRIAWRLSK